LSLPAPTAGTPPQSAVPENPLSSAQLTSGSTEGDLRAELAKAKEMTALLSEKVKKQARDLQEQAEELERAQTYGAMCEQRLKELLPDGQQVGSVYFYTVETFHTCSPPEYLHPCPFSFWPTSSDWRCSGCHERNTYPTDQRKCAAPEASGPYSLFS